MKDLLIIGGGPAGVAAGVYASRKLLSTDIVAEEIGGQSTVSEGIENWIGTVRIHGQDLIKAFKEHLNAYKGDVLTVHEGKRVETLSKAAGGFVATLKSGEELKARAVLIASGAARRRLDVPGADRLEHKGLTYCASCDGPLFGGMDVVVIGGGNAGFESALQLLAYCKSVTLIHRHSEFKADAITVRKAMEYPNFTVMTDTEPVEVLGEKLVSGLIVRNRKTNETQTLQVGGIFVEVGVVPNTGFAKDLVELDSVGRVVTDPKNQHTSVEGVWAAGDCTDELYHQNNIAAGDAVKAIEDIYVWIKTRA
ncbi:MAG TPA: FAD-dependent oxidoreductase [Candidatus Paceibacterota bacterium]|nr:FAD-dependent oxidoreductase [Candidatus Paceibacterota bacterium]